MREVQKNSIYSTGRRKEAVARVWLMPSTNSSSKMGKITVNRRELEDYFGREVLRMIVRQPLEVVNSLAKYDVFATVAGGGLSGQADAIKLGISRALSIGETTNRPPLKKIGYLTRDSRAKERKKYGQRGARARFQFSKR